ncbi:MAG: hypothetical protein EXS09_18930 [Gemmataceae bacterium]|nr:hypothetical protein [Gemmataceae bacterium]
MYIAFASGKPIRAPSMLAYSHKEARVVGIAANVSANGSDAVVKRRQVELLDKGPNVANGMVGAETLVERLGDHPALRTFGKSQPRGGLGFGNNVIQGAHPARKGRFHKKNYAPLPIRE